MALQQLPPRKFSNTSEFLILRVEPLSEDLSLKQNQMHLQRF